LRNRQEKSARARARAQPERKKRVSSRLVLPLLLLLRTPPRHHHTTQACTLHGKHCTNRAHLLPLPPGPLSIAARLPSPSVSRQKKKKKPAHMASVMHRSSSDGGSSSGWSDAAAAVAAAAEERAGWEVRPSGMVVQARGEDGGAAPPRPPPPEIRVRVKYGGARHEVSVSPIATFGQLKKLLAPRTGLQAADQQLSYRGRARGNAEYLDACGVKNKSKLVLAEDPASLERRYIERQRNAKIETANRAIGAIALEVDKLADQVSSIERSISRGNKVAEVQITTLIELLMRHAVKLESIPAVGDSSSQRNIQSKRVQKCVETLDVLKVSNARLQAVVVTTKWETFDAPATTQTQWELFD
ncbi:hypothetical protein U9M48_033857, partial [Paspalum notatum var. saurae]